MSQIPEYIHSEETEKEIITHGISNDRTGMFVFFIDEFAIITDLAKTDQSSALHRMHLLAKMIPTFPSLTEHEILILSTLIQPMMMYCTANHKYRSWADAFANISLEQSFSKQEQNVDNASVYFLLSEDKDLVKIGYSKNVTRRIQDLEAGSPVKLHLLKEIPGGAKKEAELHRKFAHLRHHREWFLYTSELKSFIANL